MCDALLSVRVQIVFGISIFEFDVNALNSNTVNKQ